MRMTMEGSNNKNWTGLTISFCLQALLCFLLVYSSFVTVFVSFIKNRHFGWQTLFLVATLTFFAGFSLYQVFVTYRQTKKTKTFTKPLKQKNKQQNKKFFLLLILAFNNLFIGFFNVSSQYPRGFNSAEIAQFSLAGGTKSTIKGSYRQQQPPLDYYFSAFSFKILGENKFAMRFHALYFYLILSFIFPLGVYFFSSSLWITATTTSLFLINHVIRLHSMDARPLSLSLLTGFLFLFFYFSYIQNHRQKSEKNHQQNTLKNKLSLFSVLSSQYLFVMSIGLQPVIFVITLFLSSFWLLKEKKTFQKLFLTHISTALLVLPFYINIIRFAKSAYKFKDPLNAMPSSFEDFNLLYFIEKYFFSFYKEMSLFFLIVIISLFAVKIHFKRHYPPSSIFLLMMLYCLILFPLIYNSVFNVLIIWGLHDWYFITFSLFLLFFMTFALKEIDQYLQSKRWRMIYFFPFFLLFIQNLYQQSLAIKNKTQFHFPYQDNSIEKIYDYLKQEGSPKDMSLDFSLVPIVFWRPADSSMNKPFFHKEDSHPLVISHYVEYYQTPPFFHEIKSDMIYYINWKQLTKRGKQSIFFVSQTEDSDYNLGVEILSHFLPVHKAGVFKVFELILTKEDKEKEYLDFLHKLNNKTPKKHKGVLLETLLHYAYKNKDKTEFQKLLEEYRNIEMSLDELAHFNKYPGRFELRRRVKYFENLEWS